VDRGHKLMPPTCRVLLVDGYKLSLDVLPTGIAHLHPIAPPTTAADLMHSWGPAEPDAAASAPGSKHG